MKVLILALSVKVLTETEMADCEADQLREEIARLAQQVQLISFLYFVCFGQWHSKLEVLDPDNFNTDAGLV